MSEKKPLRSHQDLDEYRLAFEAAMEVFEISRSFPSEERCALTDQIRRSSRSVNANLAEAWRKRRYGPAFVAKLNDAEAEAAKTQTWLEFGVRCGYMEAETGRTLYRPYDDILGKIVSMIAKPAPWLLDQPKDKRTKARK